MKTHWLILLAALGVLTTRSCRPETLSAPEKGTLTGVVTIGPLCPVEPCSLTNTERDAIYRAYSLSLRRTDTQTIEGTIQNLDHTGAYSLTLPPGTYLIECGQCLRKNVTTPVTVIGNQSIRKDIDIDTGIR